MPSSIGSRLWGDPEDPLGPAVQQILIRLRPRTAPYLLDKLTRAGGLLMFSHSLFRAGLTLSRPLRVLTNYLAGAPPGEPGALHKIG
jgi:hypothetical protein